MPETWTRRGPEMLTATVKSLLTILTIFAAFIFLLFWFFFNHYYLHFVICNMLPLILMYVCLGEILFLFFFEIGFHYVALAGLDVLAV